VDSGCNFIGECLVAEAEAFRVGWLTLSRPPVIPVTEVILGIEDKQFIRLDWTDQRTMGSPGRSSRETHWEG